MGKGKKVTIGYRYHLGIHFVLCHGQVDSIRRITVGDREAWKGTHTGGGLYVNKPELFGGDKKEGGIQGTIDLVTGSPTEPQNSYLLSVLGSGVPAYRGVASLILRQVYVGTNPYLKKWGFLLTRILKRSNGATQWYSTRAAIGTDMNPAHIIRECLTDLEWGMGYTDADVDDPSFTAAADTLYSEGFGMSLLWSSESSIEDFVKDVLRHIDASLYVDRATGKFKLYLIRPNYSPSSVIKLDENNVVAVEEYACSTLSELCNTVIVNYWDAATGNNNSITVQDIAMIQAHGCTVSNTMEYGGITKGDLAMKVASRDLKALSTPIIRCSVTVSRNVGNIVPGGPVRLDWPDFGISNLIMRIGEIDLGTATDNSIKLSLIQDVFSSGTATYAPPVASEWQPVITAPVPVQHQIVLEAPYYTLVQGMGEDAVNARLNSLPELGVLLVGAARPSPSSISAQVWTTAGSVYADETVLDFCATGVCLDAVTKIATTIPLSDLADWMSDTVAAGDYAVLNGEIVAIVSFTATSVTVKRGALDTVPANHAAGSRLYVLSTFNGQGQTEYVMGETVKVKLRTVAGTGLLPESSAPVISVKMNRRALRPYPPGNWKINSAHFPETVTAASLTTTWAHRSRTQQTGGSLIGFTDGSVGPEPGTTYTLRLYNNTSGGLLHTSPAQTGTSYTFPVMAAGTYTLRMELWSVRDGLTSLQTHSHVFIYTVP